MAPAPAPPRVPAADPLDQYRERLSRRRSLLARATPAAVDLAAESLAGLHGILGGSVETCSGPRNGRYARSQLLGERALPLEDLAWWSLQAPRAAVEALRPLARAAGYRLVPAAPLARAIPEAAAQLDAAASRVSAGMLRALADGVVDDIERRALAVELAHLQRRLSETDRSLCLGATA
jgi:hypothetical protein